MHGGSFKLLAKHVLKQVTAAQFIRGIITQTSLLVQFLIVQKI